VSGCPRRAACLLAGAADLFTSPPASARVLTPFQQDVNQAIGAAVTAGRVKWDRPPFSGTKLTLRQFRAGLGRYLLGTKLTPRRFRAKNGASDFRHEIDMLLYVGRERETAEFLQLRRKRTASLVVCQGRRRIGKTTFVRKCAERFDHFLAFEGLAPRPGMTPSEQLDAFAEQLARQTELPKLELGAWPAAFQVLSTVLPSSGWTVLLLDEISWMAIGDPDFAGHLKMAWDGLFSRRSRLVLVLCGSVSSWIDRNILDSTGFVGRCSRQFELGPLDLSSCNRFWHGRAASVAEKLRILAVTGGVPRYLEEVDPSESAEQNVRRLCFDPGGLLRHEFDQIFHGIFSRRAASYRSIVATLADGPRTVSETSAHLRRGRGGSLSEALEDLTRAGFIARDVSFDPPTGRVRPRALRYRLSDNYVRFYLKYVAPRREQIDKGLLRSTPLESVIAWDAIMGLQFENLMLGSFDTIRTRLGLEGVPILNAGAWIQRATRRRRGCQIDLMITTRHAVYVIEVKLRRAIDISVLDEVRTKVDRLRLPAGLSVRTGLVYAGDLHRGVTESDYFDHLIPVAELLDG